ncbi:MAG: hypothetical protein E7295_11250 [Lachnospiraceae bacterium]|nr:hypothetical protein [Lachnospiraceae bacterium]
MHPKRLGARTGFICVLHNWGSKLNYHPHLQRLNKFRFNVIYFRQF